MSINRHDSARCSAEAYDLKAILAATKMPAKKAASLEQHLLSAPEQEDVRVSLIAYYCSHMYGRGARQAREAGFKHMLWLIENSPAHPYLAFEPATLVWEESAYYEIAKAAWLRQIAASPTSVTILINAANFCSMKEEKLAVDLLQRALELEPENFILLCQLAHVFRLHMSREDHREDWSQQAYKAHCALAAAKPTNAKILSSLASVSLRAGQLSSARESAERVLEIDKRIDSPFVHEAHSVLGLICLMEGDTKGAKDHLLASGNWPEFDLANALIKAGERRIVSAHLSRTARPWRLGNTMQILVWQILLALGRSPVLQRTSLLMS